MKKIFIINIIIVLIIIIFIEGILRIFSNITPQGISKGIINTSSNPVFNFANINQGKVFGENVFTDKNGFRIPEKIQIKSQNNQKKIYFIGGSVTFGSGVNQSKTFSGVLNDEIKYLEIVNASVIGSNLKNNLDIIKKKIDDHNLERIFINFSMDDLVDMSQVVDNEETRELLSVREENNFISNLKKNKILMFVNNFVRSKSVTYVWLKGYFLNSSKSYYLQALNSFQNKNKVKSLDLLLADFSEQNILLQNKITFLVIPYNYQIRDENCKQTDYAEDIIIDKLTKYKFNVLNFKDIFCSNSKKEKIFLKFDPSHLSEYGHMIIANTLIREIN